MNLTDHEKVLLKAINDQPSLFGFLYDLDLLPEQLTYKSWEWGFMCALTQAWILGYQEAKGEAKDKV